MDVEGRSVRIEFDDIQGMKPAEEKFNSYGIGARKQATFQWMWDTAGSTAGDYPITFSVQPDGPTWRETVSLSPHGQVPPPEPYARWASTESDCCLVNYIKHTTTERDLSALLDMLDKQAEITILQFGTNLSEAVTVTFLPRVLGHGGFASQGISVSYLDRNYTGGDTATIIHHEMVHVLDSRLGGELRPTMLVEGLAVYLSGGHFKPEALMPRAAALLPPEAGCVPWTSSSARVAPTGEMEGCGLDLYVDFASLVDNFYLEQHEAGYMEAGALIEYMVETWGWDAFSEFYRDIQAQPEPSEGFKSKNGVQYRAMNAALVAHFGITLEQLEKQFILALSQEKLTPEQSEDVRLTVLFYNSIRRYQQLLDPSAYFLTAWIPDAEQMQKRGIVADYLRRPAKLENLALESMFVTANSYLLKGQYERIASTLEAANVVMDSYPDDGNLAFAADPIAADYFKLVEAVSAEGYKPEGIQIEGEIAQVWASKDGWTLTEFLYLRNQDGWMLTSEGEP
jgi:hypothetical protein